MSNTARTQSDGPEYRGFEHAYQVLDHWESRRVALRDIAWRQRPPMDKAHRALKRGVAAVRARIWRRSVPVYLNESTAALSMFGRFLVGTSGTGGTWFVYHAESGLILNDKQEFQDREAALAWANDLEHARDAKGAAFDWSPHRLGERLRLDEGFDTVDHIALRGRGTSGSQTPIGDGPVECEDKTAMADSPETADPSRVPKPGTSQGVNQRSR